MNIGEIISKRRTELDLTLEEIGNACGVGKGTVKKWEYGIISSMRCDKLTQLAKVLRLNIADLLEGTIEPESRPRELHETLFRCPLCGQEYVQFIRTVGVRFADSQSEGVALEFRCGNNHTFHAITENCRGRNYFAFVNKIGDVWAVQPGKRIFAPMSIEMVEDLKLQGVISEEDASDRILNIFATMPRIIPPEEA